MADLSTISKPERTKRSYSAEFKSTALAAYDANGGNLKATARQLDMPPKTLSDWVKDRDAKPLDPEVSDLIPIKKGSLAEKLERNLHLMVDAVHSKIKKSTLSQLSVGIGIHADKLRDIRMRDDHIPDPAAEICRLLGYQRKELPTSFTLDGLSPEDREFVQSEIERYAEEDGIDLSQLVRPRDLNVVEMRESGPGEYEPANSNSQDSVLEARIDPPANEGQQAESGQPEARPATRRGLDPEFFAGVKRRQFEPERNPWLVKIDEMKGKKP